MKSVILLGAMSCLMLMTSLFISAPASAASISWTPHAAAQQNGWRGVTWSPQLGLFVAVSDNGTNRVMTSPDGINWIARTAASQIAWHSVTWSSDLGLFVAVAADASVNSVMTSPDGINWTTRTIPSGIWRGVTWSDDLNLFVAVASFGTNSVATSPDGITWTARAVPNDFDWWSVVWSPERAIFVATSVSGTTDRVMTSPDGITWTARTASEISNWISVTWSPELGLFAAVASNGTNRIMTSPDGITWTSRTTTETITWEGVTWSPELGLFVAVGIGGRVATSSDGITWTGSDAAESNNWFPIVWSPQLGVFVSTATSGTNRVMVGRLFDITTTTVAAGNVGTAYSQPVAAIGGTGPYTWSIATGTLPPGLTLNASTGVISGTPTAAGTYNFTVQANDAGTGIETQDLTIIIAAANPGTSGDGTLAETGVNRGSLVLITTTLLIAGVGALLLKNQRLRKLLK